MHRCIGCGQPSYLYDKSIGQWVCESNPACALSKNVTTEQHEAFIHEEVAKAREQESRTGTAIRTKHLEPIERAELEERKKQNESIPTGKRRWRK